MCLYFIFWLIKINIKAFDLKILKPVLKPFYYFAEIYLFVITDVATEQRVTSTAAENSRRVGNARLQRRTETDTNA